MFVSDLYRLIETNRLNKKETFKFAKEVLEKGFASERYPNLLDVCNLPLVATDLNEVEQIVFNQLNEFVTKYKNEIEERSFYRKYVVRKRG